jgi:hypothetical protein
MANNRKDPNEILQSCLEAIQRGDETVGSILARYPEFEGELRPQLEAAHWLIQSKESFNPRPEFVSASRRRLMAQIRQGKGVAAPPPLSLWERILHLDQPRLAFQFAMAMLVLFFLIFGSSRAVLAAQYAIPGDALYGVKIAQERFQVLISITDAGDARLHTRFAQRRLLEIQELILENRFEYITDTVEAYQTQVNRAIRALERVAEQNPSVALEIATQMQEALEGQTAVLALLSETVPGDAGISVQRALDISEDSVRSVERIRLMVIAQATPTPTPTFTATSTSTNTSVSPILAPGSQTDTPTASASVGPSITASITPLVSATPSPTRTPTPTNTRSVASNATPTASNTPKPATKTPTFTPSATRVVSPSNTPTFTPTSTKPGVTPPTNTPTFTATSQQPAPTSTFTPTSTSPANPTPTWTPSPTPVTPSPTATQPPPPPTDTPVPACEVNIAIHNFEGNKVYVRIDNSGANAVTLTRLRLDWPLSNEELKDVRMGGAVIWSTGANSSPTVIDQWEGSAGDREVPASGIGEVRFTFKRDAAPTGYSVAFFFGNNCSSTISR